MNMKSFIKRIMALTLCLIMVLGAMPMTAFAAGYGDQGYDTSHQATYVIDGNNVFVYITGNGGTVTRISGGDDDSVQQYRATADENWEFAYWSTYYVGPSTQASNTTAALGYYYFSVPGDEDTPYSKTNAVIQINEEVWAQGVYYLQAIFEPKVTVSINDPTNTFTKGIWGDSPATTLDNVFFSGTTESVSGYVPYGATIKVRISAFSEQYAVESITVHDGSYRNDFTYEINAEGNFIDVNCTTIKRPTNVTINVKKKEQIIGFDANDGTGYMAAQTFEYGVAQALTANSFIKTGYTFSGWNTEKNGSGTGYSDKQSITFTPANDGDSITLYAQWTQCTNHNWVDGECNKCGALCSHSGGSATCTEKATCSECGERYGELAAHNVVYTGSNNRIVETCTAGCGHTATADLVRDESVLTVYNGSAIEALKVSYSDNWQSGDLEIDYSNNINAGTASGAISVGDATATQTFEIAGATMTDVSAQGYSGTYDGLAHGITVNTPAGATVSYKVGGGAYSTENPTFKDVGTYTVSYKVSVMNYADVEGTAEVQITKAPLTVTANDHSIEYGEAPANNGVTYSGFVANENVGVLGGTLAYNCTYNQYDNVGDYDITVSGLTSDNYEITFVKGNLTVEQKEIGIVWSNTALTYDGTEQKPTATATGVVNGDELALTVSGEQVNASDTAYTATVTAVSGEKAGNYKLPSNVSTDFTIAKADQAAPTGLSKTDETISKKADGTISGVTANMEYRKEGETTYEGVNSSVLENLAAGKYYVRYVADYNNNASPDTVITIGAGRKLKINVPQNQVGYTLTSDAYEFDYLDNATLTFTLKEGYSKGENFKIVLNGNPDAQWNNGQLPLIGIYTDVNIVVEGVVDITAPAAEIDIKGNKWVEFWNNITFGIFFNETQEVVITATDAGSGVNTIQYYLADGELELDEVLAITEWVEYNGTFKINPNNRYVVYAKITDNVGNTTYINSDGIVLDNIAPTLEGIENGKTYYGDLTVIKSDEQFYDIKMVTLDGEPMGFAEGTYGLIPVDNAEHTVVVEDHAGNKTTYVVTVMKNYTVTYKVDSVVVDTQTVGHGKDATAPAVPAKDGYTGKWDHDGKNITSDIVINAVYTENSASAPSEPQSPQTGDNSHMMLWFALLFISGGALITLTVADRKNRTASKR